MIPILQIKYSHKNKIKSSENATATETKNNAKNVARIENGIVARLGDIETYIVWTI